MSTLFIIIFIIIFVLGQLSPALNSFALYVLVPFVFLYSLVQNPKLIWNYKPLLYFFLFIIWSAFTCVKSVYLVDSLNELITLLGGFAFCYIITHFSIKNSRYIYLFYIIYILLFLVFIYRAYKEGLMNSLVERFSTENINANIFGYLGFNAIISSFFVWEFAKSNVNQIKNKINIHAVLFFVLSCLALMSNLFAASRAGSAICLLTIILFISIKFLYPFSYKTLQNLIILYLLVLVIFPYGSGLFEVSNLKERILTESLETDSRPILMEEAYNVFLENPLLGVGPGNFKYYSHNRGYGGFSHSTFFEILANNGIFGFILFLIMILIFLKNILKYNPTTIFEKKTKLYWMVFIVMFIMYQFFYVFHTSPLLISFYYLVLIHSYLYINNKQRELLYEEK